MVVFGIVYDIIVEPPGIGSTQDHATGAVKPVVFLSGCVNGQYIIEGISSGFMSVLGGVGIVLMDLALDRNRARSVKISFASAGIMFVVINFGCTFSSALTNEHGRVQAIWGRFSTQAIVKKDPVRRQVLRVKGFLRDQVQKTYLNKVLKLNFGWKHVRDETGTIRVINWCGSIVQDAHSAIRALRFLPKEEHGVYITSSDSSIFI